MLLAVLACPTLQQMQLTYTGKFHQIAWQLLNADTSIYLVNSSNNFIMPETAADAL